LLFVLILAVWGLSYPRRHQRSRDYFLNQRQERLVYSNRRQDWYHWRWWVQVYSSRCLDRPLQQEFPNHLKGERVHLYWRKDLAQADWVRSALLVEERQELTTRNYWHCSKYRQQDFGEQQA
jgi:hypothetical protein